MQPFMDHFKQGGKYSAQIARYSQRAHYVQTECAFCEGVNQSTEQCFLFLHRLRL